MSSLRYARDDIPLLKLLLNSISEINAGDCFGEKNSTKIASYNFEFNIDITNLRASNNNLSFFVDSRALKL